MAFLIGSSTDLAIARLVRYAWADLSRRLPPRGFLHRALVLAQGCDEAVGSRWIEATRREGPLQRAGLLSLEDAPALGAERGVLIEERVVDRLSGRPFHPRGLMGFEVGEPPARLRRELSSKLRKLVAREAGRRPGPPGDFVPRKPKVTPWAPKVTPWAGQCSAPEGPMPRALPSAASTRFDVCGMSTPAQVCGRQTFQRIQPSGRRP